MTPRLRLARRVPHPGRKVANNQHRRMAEILKGSQLADRDTMAQVDLRTGGINTKFNAEGAIGGSELDEQISLGSLDQGHGGKFH